MHEQFIVVWVWFRICSITLYRWRGIFYEFIRGWIHMVDATYHRDGNFVVIGGNFKMPPIWHDDPSILHMNMSTLSMLPPHEIITVCSIILIFHRRMRCMCYNIMYGSTYCSRLRMQWRKQLIHKVLNMQEFPPWISWLQFWPLEENVWDLKTVSKLIKHYHGHGGIVKCMCHHVAKPSSNLCCVVFKLGYNSGFHLMSSLSIGPCEHLYTSDWWDIIC